MNDAVNGKTIPWADAAKAVCICLVVIMHGEGQIPVAGWEHHARIAQICHNANQFLEPIRMPTFFLVSGILSANAISSSRPGALLIYGIKPLYLYFLWAAIYAVLLPNYPDLAAPDVPDHSWIAKAFFMGALGWYLYALSLFYLFCRVTRSLPAGPILALCAAAALWFPLNRADWASYPFMLVQYLFFFAAGVRCKDAIVDWADTATPARAVILFAVYVAAWLLALDSGTIVLPVNVLGVAFSVTFFACAFRSLGLLAPVTHWAGRRTLFIYLLHFPLICLASFLLKTWGPTWLLESYALGLASPLIVAMLVVPTCLAIGDWSKRSSLRWLFDLPIARRAPAPLGDLPAQTEDGPMRA